MDVRKIVVVCKCLKVFLKPLFTYISIWYRFVVWGCQ